MLEASSSRGTSSLRKCFHYEGYNTPDMNPDHGQEGVGRNVHSYRFNDRSDESLTDNEMPDIRQVIKGGPSAAECAASEAARSKAVASGILPVTPDPRPNHMANMASGGGPYGPRLYQCMPRTGERDQPLALVVQLCTDRPPPVKGHGRNASELRIPFPGGNGVYRHIEKAWELARKMKRGQRLESTIIHDNTTPEDIQKVIIAW
jgi:hypothetical protein